VRRTELDRPPGRVIAGGAVLAIAAGRARAKWMTSWFREAIMRSDLLLDSAAHQFHLNAVTPLRLAREVARLYWRDQGPETSPITVMW
jgi:hypothetical protein